MAELALCWIIFLVRLRHHYGLWKLHSSVAMQTLVSSTSKSINSTKNLIQLILHEDIIAKLKNQNREILYRRNFAANITHFIKKIVGGIARSALSKLQLKLKQLERA